MTARPGMTARIVEVPIVAPTLMQPEVAASSGSGVIGANDKKGLYAAVVGAATSSAYRTSSSPSMTSSTRTRNSSSISCSLVLVAPRCTVGPTTTLQIALGVGAAMAVDPGLAAIGARAELRIHKNVRK